jgi:hypothetical protein
MAARDRDDLGTPAMEIASHACAFAVTGLRDNQPLRTAMTAMSILAMAMVICLFGGYVDSPNQRGISTGVDDLPDLQSQSSSDEKESMIMNRQRNSIAAWSFSTWFALLSPVIGVLLGLFGAFLFLR